MEFIRDRRLKRILMTALATTALTTSGLTHHVYAADEDEEQYDVDYNTDYNSENEENNNSSNFNEEDQIDNKYAYNTIEANEDNIVFNGAKVSNSGEYEYTFDVDESNGSANIVYNTITVNGGTVKITANLNDGTYSGSFSGNEINLNNGLFSTTINGVNISGASINDNILNINGGTWSNNYISLSNATASGNTINISGNPDLSSAYIYGGILGDVGNSSNNTLNIYTSGLSAVNIYDVNNINFYLPSSISNGDTVLTLNDTSGTNISGTSINAGVRGGANLNNGDTITLITNSNGLTVDVPTQGTLSEGVSIDYDLSFEQSGNNLNAIVNTGGELNDQTEAIAQAPISNVIAIDAGTDRLIDVLAEPDIDFINTEEDTSAVDVYKVKEIHGFSIFGNIGGGSIKTKTGGDSYVKSKMTNMDFGFARSFKNSAGVLSIAPVVEYGRGNYDTYLGNGINGTGKSRYIAGGLVARQTNNNGFYYEGSFRAGRSDTDFDSGDFVASGNKVHVNYDTSAPVFAGHVKLGKKLRMDKNNLLDMYGIYAYTRQGSMSADLNTGEHYSFDSVDASRFRVGYKLTTRVSRISYIYSGLAYQYETNADSTASYRGIKTHSSGASGSSGMLELGWIIKPIKDNPWAVDIYATGWAGHQKGATAMAKFSKVL